MMKRIAISIVLVFALFRLCGCSFVEEPITSSINYLFQASEEITVISIEDLVNNVAVSIDDPQIINRVIAMFNGWRPEENCAQPKDLLLGCVISFGDHLSIRYRSPGEQTSYYAYVGNGYYYLPPVFGEYIDELISGELA